MSQMSMHVKATPKKKVTFAVCSNIMGILAMHPMLPQTEIRVQEGDINLHFS